MPRTVCQPRRPLKLPRAYVIGLGANLGPRADTIRAALDRLGAVDGVTLGPVSLAYEAEPVGPPQPWYLNLAARVETALDPDALFEHLLAIETQLGRVRVERWGPRTIDLDVLWCDDPDAGGARVTVPHPELERRWFALAPLLDVAPEARVRYAPILNALGGAPRAGSPLHALAISSRITES